MTVLNANSFFFNKNGTPRPVLKQNQFGGNSGGPVPKLKDTFFFGSYQGTRQRNGVAGGISTQFPVLPASRSQADIETAFGLAPGSLNPVALALLNVKGQYGGFLVPSGQGTPGQFGLLTFSSPSNSRRINSTPTWTKTLVRSIESPNDFLGQYEHRRPSRWRGCR